MALALEQLEPRLCAAVAAFTVALYEDAGGVPGDATGDTVEVGDAFFVEIMAREYDPARAGLRGVSLDIAWDPDVLKEIDAPFGPRQVITPNLPAIWGGQLDNAKGTITNLTGSASVSGHFGRPIGNLWPERFALLHFLALQEGDGSPFSMSQGASGIATVPVSSLGKASLYFEPQTITVVDREPWVCYPAARPEVAIAPSPPLPPAQGKADAVDSLFSRYRVYGPLPLEGVV